MHFWRIACVATALGAAILSNACSDDDESKCPKDNPECKELSTVASGLEAVGKRGCKGCHGDDMAGKTEPLGGVTATPQGDPVELYPPNLTSDETTGVGTWSDDALALAIRSGVDHESQALCSQMTHFSQMTDFEVYSIVKYLRSIPKVSKQVPRSVCPPTKTKEQQNASK